MTLSLALIRSDIVLNAAEGRETARTKLRTSDQHKKRFDFFSFVKIYWSKVSENGYCTKNTVCVCPGGNKEATRPPVSFRAKENKTSPNEGPVDFQE